MLISLFYLLPASWPLCDLWNSQVSHVIRLCYPGGWKSVWSATGRSISWSWWRRTCWVHTGASSSQVSPDVCQVLLWRCRPSSDCRLPLRAHRGPAACLRQLFWLPAHLRPECSAQDSWQQLEQQQCCPAAAVLPVQTLWDVLGARKRYNSFSDQLIINNHRASISVFLSLWPAYLGLQILFCLLFWNAAQSDVCLLPPDHTCKSEHQ